MIALASLVTFGMAGCGGGGSSSSGSGNGSNEEVGYCVSFGDDTVINSCDFDIVVRELTGSQPSVTVPANSSVTNTTVVSWYGACRAPFIPVVKTETTFSCSGVTGV